MVLKSRLPLWAWIAISIAHVVACDVLNFSDMMWGGGSLSTFIASLAYVLIWIALVFINRYDRKFIIFFNVISLITVVAGLLGLGLSSDIISNNDVLRVIGIIGVPFTTPLYGIRFVMPNNSFPLLYAVTILLPVVGVVFGFVLAKKAG